MSIAAMHPSPAARRRPELLAALSETCVRLLIGLGLLIIFVPMLLTPYLSVFDEKLILFPPRGYTLSWYGAIWKISGARLRSRWNSPLPRSAAAF